ncbi:MAG: signal peptidase I [Planctomycetota bacterium]
MLNKKKQDSGASETKHHWRDNIEAITISIVIIVLFKFFVLEAYKIPTGSMQPTLMGWDNGKGGGVFDHVLVDKLSYQFREPERFEVAVFKYPLDKSKNFIKRIWGLGGEFLSIRSGDVFISADGKDWHIPRRSDHLLATMLRKVDTQGGWHVPGEGWSIEGDDLIAAAGGQAQFPARSSSVVDAYSDGYPGKLGEKVLAGKRSMPKNTVGDLRVAFDLCPAADCREVEVEFHEGPRRYRMQIPGPAATDREPIRLSIVRGPGDESNQPIASVEPFRLESGDCVAIEAQNLDDELRLSIDGKIWLQAPIDPISDQLLDSSGIRLRTTQGGARFQNVRVWRDIYYTDKNLKYSDWQIPEGHYVMLGDNTQDSSDSRDWQLVRYEVHEGDQSTVVQGNHRNNENPRFQTGDDGTLQVFLMDDLGERHVFAQSQSRELEPVQASFVPRELIRGRAVMVVWPMVPSLDVYRLRWVR